MGWWTDIAIKKTGCPNVGGRMQQQRGVIVHIAQGSYQGTISWQMNPASQVSSHFIVSKGGEITQMVDTDYTAWTQSDGNGKWLSIENEGFVPDKLTQGQLDAQAKILRKANQVYGVPIQVCDTPADYGLGHHSMGAENGYNWGHSECPGSNIKNQKPAIVDLALGEDVSASDIWNYDVDPTSGKYSAGGAAWTTLGRTGYLANTFAPQVINAINQLGAMQSDQADVLSMVGSALDDISARLCAIEERLGG